MAACRAGTTGEARPLSRARSRRRRSASASSGEPAIRPPRVPGKVRMGSLGELFTSCGAVVHAAFVYDARWKREPMVPRELELHEDAQR
eukprot:3711170-Pyramimonas_sp.AAC.1